MRLRIQSASVVDEGAGLFIPSPVHPSRGANLVKVVKIGVSSNLSDSSQFGLAGQSVTSRQSVRCHVSWSVSHHVSLSICQSRQLVSQSVRSVGQSVSHVSWSVSQSGQLVSQAAYSALERIPLSSLCVQRICGPRTERLSPHLFS